MFDSFGPFHPSFDLKNENLTNFNQNVDIKTKFFDKFGSFNQSFDLKN